jgi:hypothetical protein
MLGDFQQKNEFIYLPLACLCKPLLKQLTRVYIFDQGVNGSKPYRAINKKNYVQYACGDKTGMTFQNKPNSEDWCISKGDYDCKSITTVSLTSITKNNRLPTFQLSESITRIIASIYHTEI